MYKEAELRVLSWNADGVRAKLDELLHLAVSGLSVDVMAICETRLSEKTAINIPGLRCYRLDKHRSGGGQGVAILMNSNIPHNLVKLPNTKHLEAIGVELSLSNKKYIIISVYQSPNMPLLPEDLDALLNVGECVIITGDFNAKHVEWGCPKNNTRGRVLLNHMLNSDYFIHAPPDPTLVHYHTEHEPTNPDLVLTRNVPEITDLRTIPALSSNHLPFTFSIPGTLNKSNIITYRYGDTNWNGFRSYLDDNLSLTSKILESTAEIDEAVDLFTTVLLDAKEKFVPKGTSSQIKPTKLPRDIRKLITTKNRLRRLSQKETCIFVRQELRSKINLIQKRVNSMITAHNDKIWQSRLAKVDNPTADLWRLAKKLRCKPVIIPPLKRHDGTLTQSTIEQCTTLADAFKSNMTLTQDCPSEDTENVVKASLSLLYDAEPSTLRFQTRPSEIKKCLSKLKRRKAPGPDEIHNILLKNLSQKAIVFLTKLFNACFRHAYFPQQWKIAKIIALLKSGKADTDATNYRPISLLSCLSKLFETLIYVRLIKVTQNLLKNEQFGFRRHHSTSQQLARVAEHVSHQLNLGASTGMFLLDLEKAFDTVWHDALLHKLISNHVPLPLVKLIRSYLEKRQFYVTIDGHRSQAYDIPAGVPQGSILGPYLFLLFVNDIPIQPHTTLALFADDTASFSSSKDIDLVVDRLQLSISLLHDYFSKWKLKLNETKTEAIMFSRQRKFPQKSIKICGYPIQWSKSVKYLGVHLDRKLNWTTHTTAVRSKGIKALGALSPLLNRRSNLSPHTKLSIYSTLVRPCLTYACPVWSGTTNANYKKLQVVQNKAVKIAYNTPFRTNLLRLHSRVKYPTLKEFILKQTRKFYLRSSPKHMNALVSNLGKSRSHNLPYIDSYKTYRLPHHLILNE